MIRLVSCPEKFGSSEMNRSKTVSVRNTSNLKKLQIGFPVTCVH